MVTVTELHVRKFLGLLDQGLSHGLGKPQPGFMCVEAAWCYALDLPHGDDPQCVSEPLRRLKIRLNDSNWSSNQARAKGLRRLGVAQIGSKGVLDEAEFVRRVVRLAIQKSVPQALRAAATFATGSKKSDLLTAADLCEKDPTRENARKARTAADAAYAAAAAAAAYAADAADARDKSLAGFAEDVVQILIDMKAPGCEWLALTEAA